MFGGSCWQRGHIPRVINQPTTVYSLGCLSYTFKIWPIWGVSKHRGTQKWMVYNGKPFWNGWFGGKPTIFGNIYILTTTVSIACEILRLVVFPMASVTKPTKKPIAHGPCWRSDQSFASNGRFGKFFGVIFLVCFKLEKIHTKYQVHPGKLTWFTWKWETPGRGDS